MNTLNLIDGFVLDGLTLDLALIQGKTYQLILTYPGNLSIGQVRGQIRKKYAEDSGELFATFNFSNTVSTVQATTTDPITGIVTPVTTTDPLTGVVSPVMITTTTIVARLNAVDTAPIPSTKYQGAPTALTTRTAYVFDIEYEENNTVIELVRGLVQVKPETTV